MFEKNEIELNNYEVAEYCLLNTSTGKKDFYHIKKATGFTGLYFKDEHTFFAYYPTKDGPMIYFEGKEYPISKDLTISFTSQGKHRILRIEEYGIEVCRIKSCWIGWDCWSATEKDVDLFCKLEHDYKTDDFYKRFTL